MSLPAGLPVRELPRVAAGVTQLIECQPSKLNVEGLNPFARFLNKPPAIAGGFLYTNQQQKLAGLPRTSIISARVKTKFAGHDYYRTSPAVSSDLILLLCDNRAPGAANGRPLTEVAPNYWSIDDKYPHN